MPRPPERIPEVLEALGELWRHPANADRSLGQLIVDLMRRDEPTMSYEAIERRLWTIEDERLLLVLKLALAELPA